MTGGWEDKLWESQDRQWHYYEAQEDEKQRHAQAESLRKRQEEYLREHVVSKANTRDEALQMLRSLQKAASDALDSEYTRRSSPDIIQKAFDHNNFISNLSDSMLERLMSEKIRDNFKKTQKEPSIDEMERRMYGQRDEKPRAR